MLELDCKGNALVDALFPCRWLKNLARLDCTSFVGTSRSGPRSECSITIAGKIAKERFELLELQHHVEFVPENDQASIMCTEGTSSTAPPLALPTSSDVEEAAEKITVPKGTQTFKFDKLGPVVVNKDGVCFCYGRFSAIIRD